MDDATKYFIVTIVELLTEIRDLLKENQRKKPRQQKIPIQDAQCKIAELWNQWAHKDFARLTHLSPKSLRYRQAIERWKEKPDETYWITAISKLNINPWAHGDNDRHWVADFEFLVRPDNHARIIEGKFDKLAKSYKKQEVRHVVGHLPDGTEVIG